MQDVDRPAQIQALPRPARTRRPRVQPEPLRLVARGERLDRIGGRGGRRGDLRQGPAVRRPEPERPVRLGIDLIAFLVHRAMVPATEQGEVRERRRPALRPVAEVVALAEHHPAAREAAAAVPVLQRPPQRRRDRPGPGPDLHEAPDIVVSPRHPARIARQAPGRFCRTQHVAIATPRPTETEYALRVRDAESHALMVPIEPDAEPDPGRLEVPRRVDTAAVML